MLLRREAHHSRHLRSVESCKVKRLFLGLLLLALVSCKSLPGISRTEPTATPLTETALACRAPEVQHARDYWNAYQRKDTGGVLAQIAPDSPMGVTAIQVANLWVTLQAQDVVIQSVEWLQTCQLDNGAYSFYIMNSTVAGVKNVDWYVLTTNTDGKIEKVQ